MARAGLQAGLCSALSDRPEPARGPAAAQGARPTNPFQMSMSCSSADELLEDSVGNQKRAVCEPQPAVFTLEQAIVMQSPDRLREVQELRLVGFDSGGLAQSKEEMFLHPAAMIHRFAVGDWRNATPES